MAKNIPNININFDNFDSWISRTNEILQAMRTEVLTANSSNGITGSLLAPLNSTLIGSFTANTISVPGTMIANSSHVTFTSTGFNIDGSFGTPGQVLTSNGSAISWATPPSSTGTVTTINTGAGLSGGPITTSGSIQIRANTGIIANTSGVFADEAYIRTVVGTGVSVSQLQGLTWESPGAIGSSTANTGAFSSVTTNTYRFGTTANSFIVIGSNGIVSPGNLDGTTPSSGTTGAIRLRARADNTRAYIQVTNNTANTEWNNVEITQNNWSFSTDLTFRNGIKVGYRNIPQVAINANTTIDTVGLGGQHVYKTTTNSVTFIWPDNAAAPAEIGTAITIINDSATGNIVVNQSGSTILQLGGTISAGNRTITPGGFATFVKVQTNKWIVSGPGVA